MAAAWNDLPAIGGLHECAALVGSAEALRVSAPELSVQLARRALLVGATDASAGSTDVGEGRNLSMRAQALLASGLVRISQHPKAVEPGFAALALAESGGAQDVAAGVRIDLAACAQQVGEPLLGGAILRPVLESVLTPPSVRATALGRLVGCVAHVARRDDIEDALSEADRLLAADNGITADVRRMERARLAVRSAGYHRWYGDTEDAIAAAREGLNLLSRVRSDLRSESDRLRARLSLELVCGLLDEGELHEAEAAAHPVVDEPVRATSAASVGRLMLALATRVYLPSGQTDRGRHLLDQAAWMAERHTLDGLRADTLTEVSRLEEQAGRAGDALEAMRSARAAEHRRMRAVSRAARIVLVEVGADHGIRDTTQQSVAAMVRQLAHPAGLPAAMAPPPQVGPAKANPSQENDTPPAAAEQAGTVPMDDEGTRLLDREALFRRLRSVRKGERPVALTLVRLEPNGDGGTDTDRGPDTGIMAGLADKVRDMAPDNAEVARSDGGELAVILPSTTRDQAEEFAATIRESGWASAEDMNISTGVVQADQATTDAAGMLTAARDALTPGQGPAQTAQAPARTPQPAPATQTPAQTAQTAQAPASTAQTAQTAQTPAQTAQRANAASLADTSAALHSALSEDTPTRPLNARSTEQGATEQAGGRSILSSLTIASGSGGRRRAGGEQPPGATSRWPAEPAEAPRWTRAERRAQQESGRPADPAPRPQGGWPAPAEEPSQGKRAATPDKPSFSETVALNRTQLPTHHGNPPGETTRRDLRTTATGTSATTTATGTAATTNEAARPPATPQETAAPAPANTRPADTPGRHGTPAPARADGPGAASPATADSADASAAGVPASNTTETPRARVPAEAAATGSEAAAASGQGADAPDVPASRVAPRREEAAKQDVPAEPPPAAVATADAPGTNGGWGSGDGGFAAGLAGLSSGGTLRGAGGAEAQRSSYEETKAELARMMSVLNAKSLASRESRSNGARQPVPPAPAVPEPPARSDAAEPAVPEPAVSDPGPAPAPAPRPEPGQRSGLMAAFDALTGPLPGLRAEFDDSAGLPARRPARSWAELESSAVVESPADDLFGTEPGADPGTTPDAEPGTGTGAVAESGTTEKPKFRSSLGAAFAEFGATEKKVTEPVKEPVKETSYDEPIGPPPRPDNLPRRGERSSATIASLLTEALAAYQSTAEDAEEHRAPERLGSYVGGDAEPQQSGIKGRHRSPE